MLERLKRSITEALVRVAEEFVAALGRAGRALVDIEVGGGLVSSSVEGVLGVPVGDIGRTSAHLTLPALQYQLRRVRAVPLIRLEPQVAEIHPRVADACGLPVDQPHTGVALPH